MKKVLSPVNVAVEHTRTHVVVHVSRLQERMVRGEIEAHAELHEQHGGVLVADWEAPRIEHFILPPQQEQQAEVGRRYPQHVWHPVLRYLVWDKA